MQSKKNENSKTEILKKAGLKVTIPRLRILELFRRVSMDRDAKRHLSAEDVFLALSKEGVEIGLATVYRVLGQFEDAGILVRRDFDEKHPRKDGKAASDHDEHAGSDTSSRRDEKRERATYEFREGDDHHDHIICKKCHEVIEFFDPEIEEAQERIARYYGYELASHSMVLYGYCEKCRAKDKKAHDKDH